MKCSIDDRCKILLLFENHDQYAIFCHLPHLSNLNNFPFMSHTPNLLKSLAKAHKSVMHRRPIFGSRELTET